MTELKERTERLHNELGMEIYYKVLPEPIEWYYLIWDGVIDLLKNISNTKYHMEVKGILLLTRIKEKKRVSALHGTKR